MKTALIKVYKVDLLKTKLILKTSTKFCMKSVATKKLLRLKNLSMQNFSISIDYTLTVCFYYVAYVFRVNLHYVIVWMSRNY